MKHCDYYKLVYCARQNVDHILCRSLGLLVVVSLPCFCSLFTQKPQLRDHSSPWLAVVIRYVLPLTVNAVCNMLMMQKLHAVEHIRPSPPPSPATASACRTTWRNRRANSAVTPHRLTTKQQFLYFMTLTSRILTCTVLGALALFVLVSFSGYVC